jgi:hypothetical protein
MSLTARSSSVRGLKLQEAVPYMLRNHYKHRMYWHSKHNKSAERYTAIASIHDKPCIRRWLEFIGSRAIPRNAGYITNYAPPAITSNPLRLWILVKDGEEFAVFTNCVEAWLLSVSGQVFNSSHKWSVLYVDLQVPTS